MRILTTFFVVLAIGAVAIPAQADLVSCVGKVHKRSGLVAYYFKGASLDSKVQWSVQDLGQPSTHGEGNSPSDFANAELCQSRGKGKACVTTSDPKLAAMLPASCVMHLYDAGTDSTCEARVHGCQPAQRPLPTEGFHAINNTRSTTACWDAGTGTEWHMPVTSLMGSASDQMSDSDARLLLKIANGEWILSDGEGAAILHNIPPALAPTGVKLTRPRLADLAALRNECEGLFRGCIPTDPCTIAFGLYSSTFVQSECAAQICNELFPERGSCVFTDTTIQNSSTGEARTAVAVRSSGDSVGSSDDILTVRESSVSDECRSVFIAPSLKNHRFSDPRLITSHY